MPESGMLLPAALGGLATGGVYALLAAALALIQGKLRLIDFGHAVGLLLGVFGLTFLVLNFGFHPAASLPVAAAFGLAGGLALQRSRTAPPSGGDPLLRWIALVVIAEFSMLQHWGGPPESWQPQSVPALFGFDYQPARAVALFAGLLGCGLLGRIVERMDFGRRVRAPTAAGSPARFASADRTGARGLGIAYACLAAGACLLVPSNAVKLQAVGGFLPIVFAVAALGARGRFRDALSGGLLIGLVEAVGRASLDDDRGLLCVLALGLFLLFGYTDRLFPIRAPQAAEPQSR